MYKNKKVSLIFPSYNEEEGISKAISEFQNTNFVFKGRWSSSLFGSNLKLLAIHHQYFLEE